MCAALHARRALSPSKARAPGFTLAELVIVIAIVGLLAAIAYPSYQNQLIKGRRAAAQSYMMDLAQRQQQYMLDTRAYADTEAKLGYSATPNEVAPYYTVTITLNGPPPGFTLTATPISGSVQASDPTLTIDDKGVKTPSTKW